MSPKCFFLVIYVNKMNASNLQTSGGLASNNIVHTNTVYIHQLCRYYTILGATQFYSFFLDVFVTTDIHNAACIPPSAKRPTNNTTTTATNLQQQTAPPQQLGTVPFSPMDQMEELDVAAAYCYPLTVSKHFFVNCRVFSRKKNLSKTKLILFSRALCLQQPLEHRPQQWRPSRRPLME